MFKIFLVLALKAVFCESSRVVSCDDIPNKGAHLCHKAPGFKKGYAPEPRPYYFHQELAILDILDLDPRDQTITISVKLRTKWNDSRITLESKDPDDTTTWSLIDKETAKDLFFPKQRIRKVKEFKEFQPYSATNDDYYWFSAPHGFVYEETFMVTIFCSFDFSTFPFDHQQCDFAIGLSDSSASFSSLMPTVVINLDGKTTQFGKSPLQFLSSRLPFDMKLSGLEPFAITHSGKNYSHAGMRVDFTRNKLSQLIGGFYGPTALLGVLSLISYSINPEVVPGRLGLLVTLNLITSNIYNFVKAPEDRGFSYLEGWMIGIQALILLGIFEYGAALSLMRFYKTTKVGPMGCVNKEDENQEKAKLKDFISNMDKITFSLASFFFFLFVISYWIIAKNEIQKVLCQCYSKNLIIFEKFQISNESMKS